MANLDFYDKHNMVAYLQKSEGSEGFHQIVDFLNTCHIKYALIENPTIYVSLIEQFWQTASASTLENGDMEITATIDGKVKVVSEASIRRHLKLEDSDGINTLPTTEIFEQLALMGYVSNSDKLTFQKGHFSPQWKFLIHTILHCLSSKKTAWEQFSSNIATAIICLATNRTFNFSKLIFDGMVKNLESKSKFLMYPRFIQIFLNKQKRLLLPHQRTYIAPSLTQKLFSNMKRASKGYTGVDTPLFQTMLVQGQISQGEGSTIPVESHHTPISAPSTSQPPTSPPSMQTTHVAEEAANMPHDSPLPGGHTPGSDEGSMTLNELTVLCTQLSTKVASLEADLKQTKKTQGRQEYDLEPDFEFTAPEEDYTAEPDISNANVPVSTAGPKVSTASPEVITAAESIVYIRISAAKRKDKGNSIMKEAEPVQKKKKLQLEQERLRLEEALRLQEQLDEEERKRIAIVQEEANTFNTKEWDNIQAQIKADEELALRLQVQEREGYSEADKTRLLVELINERKRKFAQQRAEQRRNKPMTQAQQRTYMCNYIKHMGSHTLQQLKKLSFDELKELFEITMKRVNTFTPMESDGTVSKVVARSSKSNAEQELNQESSKRQKIGEGSEPAEESKDKESDELSQE
ncbi:hypothetical protein Tco_0742461 [Tanacetum coccineum]